MKITAIEPIVLRLPNRSSYTWRSLEVSIGHYVILKITTDAGITGLGEAPAIMSWGGEHGRYFGEDPGVICHLLTNYIEPMLIGQDPHDLKPLANESVAFPVSFQLERLPPGRLCQRCRQE